jgi:Cu(I)/Ag(I) efflux system periplasmic protein CusF
MDRILIVAFLAVTAAPGAQASGSHDHKAASAVGQGQAAKALAHGEIRRIDKEAQKVTIRHGPLRNLDMPAMTMVFQVKDAAMLDRVQPGDKVNFEAEKVGGAYIVTRMEPAK